MRAAHSITEVLLPVAGKVILLQQCGPSGDKRDCKAFSLSSDKGRKSHFLNHLLMTVPHQKQLGLCLAIFGFILGAFAGLWLGRSMLLRTAKADLSDYAQQLSRNADALRGELSGSFGELNMP